MPYTYPAAAPTLSGDQLSISRFLSSPTLVARSLRTQLQQRFIGDSILSRRFIVNGGAVVYETGESIFSVDNPASIAPGAEYPLTALSTSVAQIAAVGKIGQDTTVTDESIKRQQMDPVSRALTKLANQNIKFVDGLALSAVATAVTQSTAVAAAWTTATAAQILQDVINAKVGILSLNMGYDPDTVVLSDAAWAQAYGKFAAAGLLQREGSDNPIYTGQFAMIAGMRWLPTPNLPVAGQALVLDSKILGGMGDENLGGEGYATVPGTNVEVKTFREDANDQWRIRARRVTVPVVVEPAAGWKITGVGV